MTSLTIIGLGQIGASFGLGLAGYKDQIQRFGHDLDPTISRRAEKIGAIDRVELNLPNAVQKADIVLLSMPVDQILDTFDFILEDLKDGAIVLDTGPTKEYLCNWAAQKLPKGRHYVGLTPVLNPSYLQEPGFGLEAAHVDLFKDSLVGIVAPPQTSGEAIDIASELVRMVNASPFYADPVEIDSFMASTYVLPQLLSAVLIRVTADKPGWSDAGNIAGKAYAQATGLFDQSVKLKALQSSVKLNQDNVLRMVDSTLDALQELRQSLTSGDETALEQYLENARKGRETWWKARKAGQMLSAGPQMPPLPTSKDVMSSFFTFGRWRNRPKK